MKQFDIRRIIANIGIRGQLSIQFALLTVFIIIIALVSVHYVNERILIEYFSNQIIPKTEAFARYNEKTQSDIAYKLSLLGESYDELWNGFRQGDTLTVKDELDWCLRAFDFNQYVAADVNGNIWAYSNTKCSESDLDEARKLVHLVKSTGHYSGCCNFLGDKSSQVMGRVITDQYGESVSIIFFSKNSLADINYLNNLKDEINVELTLFESNVRLATTLTDKDGKTLTGTVLNNEEIINTVLIGKQPWYGPLEIYGKEYYAAYLPIFAADGSVNQMVLCGLDIGIHKILNQQILLLLLICIAIGGVIVSALFVYYSVVKLANPLISLTKSAECISNGDLTTTIEKMQGRGDEIGLLSISMDKMLHSLRDIITPTLKMSHSIMSSSKQLSSASMEMSDSANRQAEALEEVSAAVEEMGATIKQTSANADETKSITDQIGDALLAVNTSSVGSLSSISKIADSIDSINSLVTQTNILSLNASVEAAKAGDLGKGFAVVAKEVGRLAELTKQTAMSINEIANNSVAEATETNDMLGKVVPKVNNAVGLVKEISVSSSEQSIGASQINTAIYELNKVTQNNAASAEHIAASAQELQVTAENMNNLIKRFKA